MEEKSECSLMARGQLRLRIQRYNEILQIFIQEASHLKHPKLKVDWCRIFVKISVIPFDDNRNCNQTAAAAGTNQPVFNETINYEILPEDSKKRLWVTVWCKDYSNGQTSLIGSMSFGMKHLLAKTQKEPVDGWFCLLSGCVGKRKHLRVPKSSTSSRRKPNDYDEQMKSRNHGSLNLPEVNLQLESLTTLTLVLRRQETGFGFTLKGSCPVLVGQVMVNSAAERAGLASGDHIKSVNGQNVSRSSAEGVARIINSTERVLVLDVCRSCNHYRHKEENITDLSESPPVLKDIAVLNVDSTVGSNTPGAECRYFGNSRTMLRSRKALLCQREEEESSFKRMNEEQRRVKRRRLDLTYPIETDLEQEYSVFVRDKTSIGEAVYEEIDEVLNPSVTSRHLNMGDMSFPSNHLSVAEDPPMTPPDSGISSAALSAAGDLDKGFFDFQPKSARDMKWNPLISLISRSIALFSPIHGIVSDFEVEKEEKERESFQGRSISSELSDRWCDKAFLSTDCSGQTSALYSKQSSGDRSNDVCSSLVHRFLSCEEKFLSNVLIGVQRFSMPLRHFQNIVTRQQHYIIFQNIEKLMRLSEFNVEILKEICFCNRKCTESDISGKITLLYASKLKLIIQAYGLYLDGLASAWRVLQELNSQPRFLSFIQTACVDNDLTIESFLQQPQTHLKEMILHFKVLQGSSDALAEKDLQELTTVIFSLSQLMELSIQKEDMKTDRRTSDFLCLNKPVEGKRLTDSARKIEVKRVEKKLISFKENVIPLNMSFAEDQSSTEPLFPLDAYIIGR